MCEGEVQRARVDRGVPVSTAFPESSGFMRFYMCLRRLRDGERELPAIGP